MVVQCVCGKPSAELSIVTPNNLTGGHGTFGGMLVRGLTASASGGSAGVSARAARVLGHLLLGNPACKQRALTIPLELPAHSAAAPQLLMPRCMANLSEALSPTGEP